jgi:anti-anti-sigma regulatory factor
MALRISQVDDGRWQTTLKIEGDFHFADAQMLENLCRDLQKKETLIIDLAGITFLDEKSARALRRLKSQPNIRLTGLRLFTEKMLEQAED